MLVCKAKTLLEARTQKQAVASMAGASETRDSS
jgi:hypothetical protein